MDDSNPLFNSTIMSVIRGAARQTGDATQDRDNVDRFFRSYGPPLRNYLVKACRLSEEHADDTLNQFILEKLLCGDAERNHAYRYLEKRKQQPDLRFRGYLIRSLKNYVLDQRRKEQRNQTISIEAVDDPTTIELPADEEDRFTRDWGTHLLLQAMKLVREDCYAKRGQELVWHVFEARIVTPSKSGAAPEPYDVLAKRLEIGSPKQASNRLQTAFRKLHAALRDLVQGYLPAERRLDEEEINDEIGELLKVAANGGLGVLEKMAELQDESWLPAKRYDLTCHPDDLWNDSDYAGIWTHLVTMPLDACLAEFDDSLARRFEDVIVWEGNPMASLSEVWTHPRPPIELIQAIKSFGKAPRGSEKLRDGNGLPTVINALLYHAAIASADLRHQTRISRDSDRSFIDRLSRLLRISWLDEPTRSLLEKWLETLR